MRDGEENGVNYNFVSQATFEDMIREDEFVEWAKVHANYYGTSKKEIDRIHSAGRIPIFDVDVQGSRSLKGKLSGAVFVLIVPPSLQVLEARLRNRNTDSEEQVQIRLKNARDELKEYEMFDYVVINDNLDQAVEECRAIITAEKCRISRNRVVLKELGGQE